jgi:hypothetical protein
VNALTIKPILVTVIIIAMGLAMVATHKVAGTGYSTTAAIFVPLATVAVVAVLLVPRRAAV